MHGRRGECRKRSRHMCSVSTRGPKGTTKAIDCDSPSSTADYFYKDGRKICIGDCALFKSPQNSPHFIGLVHSLTSDKENLQLCVNRLYRPIELKLGKGILLDTLPNEVFYSFQKNEIPAASLLHPCKVAFLPKGVELPSGISSFICHRIIDIDNRCLRWLTDQDYIDEQQAEVDQLLNKTQVEMHATVQSGGRSPKPINGPTSTSQLKSGSDNVQTATSIPSQAKGRKRERVDQSSEPVKRERALKAEDGDSGQQTLESILRSYISRITEKGGLVDSEGVEKLVQLMQSNKVERKLELGCRSMFVGVIAATENFDCFSQFVQLKGLRVLDQWLQDVHKGKVGDGSPKDNDKSVEEFLFILLRALERLPVNLQALQLCNIGKSVNHLRTYKNPDIQKKARSLVDTWKKRVEAEMNVTDAKSGSSQAVSWPSRTRLPEGSPGNRQCSGSSEAALRSSAQFSASKIASNKPVQMEMSAKLTSPSPGATKIVPSPASGKDGLPKSVVGSNPDLPSATARDERSSSSSQSHNNSQSCSSDHAKAMGFSGKEDARSSTAGSISVNKVSGGSSRPQRSVNGYPRSAPSGSPREIGSSRISSLHRNLASEKISQSELTSEKTLDLPSIEGSSHKLIVKSPSRGRSPNASVRPVDDPTVMHSRASSPVLSEKHEHSGHDSKEKANSNRANDAVDVKTESWQSNDFKDILTGSDEGDGSPDAIPEVRYINGEDDKKLVEVSRAVFHSSDNELKLGQLQDASLSSINALIESCDKYSQLNASTSAGDDGGMNLLASVAAGEMSKSNLASPDGSSERTTILWDEQNMGDSCKIKSSLGNDLVHEQSRSEDGLYAVMKEGNPLPVTPEQAGEKDPNNSSNLSTQIKEQLNEVRETASVAPSPSFAVDKVLNGGEDKQLDEKATIVKSSDIAKIETDKSKDGSLSMENKVDEVPSCLNVQKEAAVDVPSYASIDIYSACKNDMGEPCTDGSYIEQKPSLETKADVIEECTGSCKDLPSESANKPDGVNLENMDFESQGGKQRIFQAISSAPSNEGHGDQITCAEADESKENESSAASFPASEASHVNKKPKFDLNEGFSADDCKLGDSLNLKDQGFPVAAHIVNPLPFTVAPMSSGLPASITIAAAAKGPFVPPMDLLRSKRELGWKGSAATSAFRPAEPRKALEMPTGVVNTPDASAKKPSRPLLDFDLNVADDRIVEDMASQNTAQETASSLAPVSVHDFELKKSLVSPPSHCHIGLDFDLNRVDEASDMWPSSVSSGRGSEVPFFQANKSVLGGYPNSESRRDFDLNDGPVLDEAVEPSLQNQCRRSNMQSQALLTGFRTSNDESGIFSSWLPAGNAFAPVTMSSILSDKGDQPFPVIAAGGPAKVLGPPTGALPFAPDLYHGSVLSSSPAVPFPSFRYPVFPLGTGFPLPSTSLSGGSMTCTDSLSNGRLGLTAPSSQLLSGPPPAFTSNYSRPYVFSLPDGSSNVGAGNNSKWTRQGLDLNAGPGSLDNESRDEPSSLVSRQISVAGSLGLAEEQGKMFQQMAGGILKRKENAENFRYKQASWQ